MSYLVDSDWVVDYLKGKPAAVSLLQLLAPQGLAISVITLSEVDEDIYYGTDPERNEGVFRQFLKGSRVLPITSRIARRFARISGDLRQQGLLIDQPDLLIAATAIEHDFTLVTRNLGHFQRISDLVIY
jgi:predicted nucleic acid-binding protein